MSLLPADGHMALMRTPEGDGYQLPLVCWRDDDTAVYGMLLYRGSLRRADQIPEFRRYVPAPDAVTSAAARELEGFMAAAR